MVPGTPPRGADAAVTTTEGFGAPAASQGRDGDLLLVTGLGRMQVLPLAGAEIVIGRISGCDVVLDHPTLSRRHAVLRLSSPPTVQDLGSKNGTRVGREVRRGGEPVRLGEGEAFHVGPLSFLLVRAARRADLSHSREEGNLLRVVDPTLEHATPLLRDIAVSGVTTLLLGETGVGKEVLAETIHRLSGRTGPYLRLNCAALSEPLLESELFGHEKGAFTGATSTKPGLLEGAERGTVFLDEIGELPLSVQAKLLRAVEAREILRVGSTRPLSIDVRFVAATNRDLAAGAAAGWFRSDLYYRLDGFSLHIPPLRERRSQIVPLALQFLAAAVRRAGGAGTSVLSPAAIAALEAHSWPGNVRELKAVVERAVVLAGGAEIGVRHLGLRPSVDAAASPAGTPGTPSAAATVAGGADVPADHLTPEELAERARIIAALDQCAGNQTRAAKQLGMSRTTLVARLQLYRVKRPRG
jgi:DNA-binding NtrC family response regulator